MEIKLTVHFIGAGPGDPELITLKGKKLLEQCSICFFAGSIIPEEILSHCGPSTKKINTAPLSLSQIIEKIEKFHNEGHEIARLHSGDLSIWSAVNEQIRELIKLKIPFSMTPGVTSFSAAASSLKQELTKPQIAQSIVLTRTEGRASKMPENETLENFAKTGAILAIHLSIHDIAKVVKKVKPFYNGSCPVKVVWKASWPEEQIIHSDLSNIEKAIPEYMDRTALILIGPHLDTANFTASKLYDETYDRRFREIDATGRNHK